MEVTNLMIDFYGCIGMLLASIGRFVHEKLGDGICSVPER
jgi:cyanate lyase